MAIKDDDLLYVQRPSGVDAGNYKITAGELLNNNSSVEVGDTAPDPAEEGDLWWCTTDGRLYVYYDDGNTQQWVDASPPAEGIPDPDIPENIYLSKVDDDTAQGAITFNQKVTLKDGADAQQHTINAGKYVGRYESDFQQVGSNNNANLRFVGTNSVGTGIGLRSVNNPTAANALGTNCPRFIFNRCQDPGGLGIGADGKIDRDNFQPANVNSVLGELNWATAQGTTDIYLARFTAYSKAKGGELELSLNNTENGEDYQYYFDAAGFFGLRFNGNNEFLINVDQGNNLTKFKTTKDKFGFDSSVGSYTFAGPDFGSNLILDVSTDLIGFQSTISHDPGKYGIKHNGNRTVSLINSNGEIRLDTNGTSAFIKGGDTVTITPGAVVPGDSKGTINAKASEADAIPYTSFDAANNRRIACFYSNNSPAAQGTTKITYPASNGPQIAGNGVIKLNANLDANGKEIKNAVITYALEADDPAAYQTTYSLDEDGQQVEEQTYIGATENLLNIIADLRARIEQLESDHATMMNNNSGGGY